MAMLAGAGIYASDMSRCKWLGNLTGNYTIFQIPSDKGPFHFSNNTVQNTSSSTINNHDLATESSQFSAVANVNSVCFPLGLSLMYFMQLFQFNTSQSSVAFGERVRFQLSSADELGNFREAVWSVSVPLETQVSWSLSVLICVHVSLEEYLFFFVNVILFQPLGSVSTNNSHYVYSVPDKASLMEVTGFSFVNGSEQITADFSLLQSLVRSLMCNKIMFQILMCVQSVKRGVKLNVSSFCHPGYSFDPRSHQCTCMDYDRDIVRCDTHNRYFYTRVSELPILLV